MTAGLSQLTFQSGVVLAPLYIASSIYGMSQDSNISEESKQRLAHILQVLKNCFSEKRFPVLLVPVAYSGHWGFALALCNSIDSMNSGSIFWGQYALQCSKGNPGTGAGKYGNPFPGYTMATKKG